MDPELYDALKGKIQLLDNTATRLTIPEGTSPATMKNRILHVAGELKIALSIRKVPGGLVFWRSAAEDFEQAKEVAQRLQPAQRKLSCLLCLKNQAFIQNPFPQSLIKVTIGNKFTSDFFLYPNTWRM